MLSELTCDVRCVERSRRADTVKFDPDAFQQRLAREQQERERAYMEEMEATRRALARRMLAEDSRYVEELGQQALRSLEEEASARRKAEAKAEEARLAEELARSQREQERARVAELRAEGLRQAQAIEEEQQRLEFDKQAALLREEMQRHAREQRRKEAVSSFLRAEGFGDVGAGKRRMLVTTYPLHRAAELGDASLVQMLIEEGADPCQRNSRGRTAWQVARAKNKNGSHAQVIEVLDAANAACASGGDPKARPAAGGA